MDTYFIRHTEDMDVDNATRDYLWDNKKIAIHFPWIKNGKVTPTDSTSLNPDDYEKSSDRRAMRATVNLAGTGGYVCAQHVNREEAMLGYIKPSSNIELYKGQWGSVHGLQGRTAILKTLQLTKVKLIKPLDCPVILVGRPRRGTIMLWPSARKIVEDIVEGRKRKIQLNDLHYSQQEIMCSEFLRTMTATLYGLPQLEHLLLPTGRSMKDVDIAGIAKDGKVLMAQVTYSPLEEAQWKIERLLPYKDPKSHLVLFCRCEEPRILKAIYVFPIEKAFQVFTSTKTGKRWLKRCM
jgi:hypothetical protein